MNTTTLFLWSKKLHRIMMFVVVFLTIVMAGTGAIMKYPVIGDVLSINVAILRYVHNQISTYFSIALVLMMLTGVYMYVFPLLRKRTSIPSSDSTQAPPKI